MRLRFLPALAAALTLALAPTLPAVAQPAPAASAGTQAADPWPFAASDLPVDPAWRFGVLENGMRYLIRPNATPPGRALVRLWVDFGSAAEEAHQQGWAHYIEHMAFNGSTNLPEGEMVPLLERSGLAFGADTNASTGFDTTLYMLDLPRADPALLDTALMLMRETVSELTFSEEAVQRERGVILSEMRSRDTFQLRSLMDNLRFLYPGSQLAQRLPIGTPETIAGATGAALRALWQQQYRPDNVALIVVGDFDPEEVEAAIRARFADWRGHPPLPPPRFGPIAMDHGPAARVWIDPALSEEVTVSANGPWRGGPDTVASRRERVLREIGYAIINRRLQRLARLEDPPFRGAGIGTSEVFREARTTNLVVQAGEGDWRRALAAAQAEYRRALAFGFTPAEVAEQVANLRSSIEANAAGAETRPNAAFITAALTLLRDGQVPTTPQSALERFRGFEPGITPQAVLEALMADLVPLDAPLIRFEGRTPPEGGEAALLAAWNEGMAAELAAPSDAQQAGFAYSDFGPPGAVVSDVIEPSLGIRQIRFANGVMLNLKRTSLQADRVLVQVNVDGGDLLATRDNPLATAMVSSLPLGGLGAHTLDELQSILAGRQVNFSVASTPDSFRMAATTTPGDLELQLQLMAAALADPAFRSAGETQYRRNIDNFFARLTATPEAALENALGAIIHDGDPRESLQSREAYLGLSFAKLREDILERWQNGAIEVALVGDVDEERAIALVAATLGALPPRDPAFREWAENRGRQFTADRSPRILAHDGTADQAILLMAWPTRDDSDQYEHLVLELLERVLRIALTDNLREKLGQTYSPSVSAEQSRLHPGFGTFTISAAIAPGDLEAARQAMLETLAQLARAPVSDDLITRARAPLLESYANALDTNAGLMALVERAQSQPERITRFRQAPVILQGLGGEDLQAAVRRYLAPEQRLEVQVLPRCMVNQAGPTCGAARAGA